jgi:fructokinase
VQLEDGSGLGLGASGQGCLRYGAAGRMAYAGAMTLALGIDLGGSKIEIIALDEEGAVLLRRRRPSPRDSYQATLEAIRAIVAETEADLGARGTVGIGTPGAISPATGLLKNSNSTWLNGQPLDRDLAAALERPVALANDADCLALSEATDGAAAGAATVFAVILGTGVGGGLAVHGRVLAGPNAIAGEWGHNPLPWPDLDELPGPPCYCGLAGCIETWLSGPGLARDYHLHSGVERDPPAIVAAAACGDAAADAALRRYEHRLARGLATVINLLDPQAIVLGGGLSQLARLYTAVPALWQRCVFSDTVRTSLVPALHGDSSGVRGAAWLGRNRALSPPG